MFFFRSDDEGGRRMIRSITARHSLAVVLATIATTAAAVSFVGKSDAAETIAYTYDAKGRLVKVARSGSVNNEVTTEYAHDKADNRKKVKTSGSPNP